MTEFTKKTSASKRDCFIRSKGCTDKLRLVYIIVINLITSLDFQCTEIEKKSKC